MPGHVAEGEGVIQAGSQGLVPLGGPMRTRALCGH